MATMYTESNKKLLMCFPHASKDVKIGHNITVKQLFAKIALILVIALVPTLYLSRK